MPLETGNVVPDTYDDVTALFEQSHYQPATKVEEGI